MAEVDFRKWHAVYCKEYSADLNPTATVRALAESGVNYNFVLMEN